MKNDFNSKKKLSLKKEVLASLDDSELVSLAGGFTSFGNICSHNNDCSRVHGGFNTIGIRCGEAIK